MAYKSLDKKIKVSWRISRLLFFVVIAAILGGATLILSLQTFWRDIGLYIIIADIGILLFFLVTVFLYPEIEYRQWKYEITDDKVEIRHGIFFITTSVIPVIRIQHISVSRGPVNRKLGLASVLIHTASGVFTIEGLDLKTCDELSENLKTKLYSRLSANQGEV